MQGEEHPDTIMSLDNYAGVLQSLGRDKEAEPLFKEALDRYRRVLGNDHPDTIGALNDYASVLISLGRAKEAELLYTEALRRAAESASLGPTHPNTRLYAKNLARCLDTLTRASEAQAVRSKFLMYATTRAAVSNEDAGQKKLIAAVMGTVTEYWWDTSIRPAGPRVWRVLQNGTWEESDPDGVVKRFTLVAIGDADLGAGLVVASQADADVEIWVPRLVDREKTYVRRKSGDQEWHLLGTIHIGHPPAATRPATSAASRPSSIPPATPPTSAN